MSWDDREPEDAFVLQAGLISERLTRIALDMNVALSHTDGFARSRLEHAITGIDLTIREVRLLAASRLRLGERGAGRRQGRGDTAPRTTRATSVPPVGDSPGPGLSGPGAAEGSAPR
jgi:hypothetical protein